MIEPRVVTTACQCVEPQPYGVNVPAEDQAVIWRNIAAGKTAYCLKCWGIVPAERSKAWDCTPEPLHRASADTCDRCGAMLQVGMFPFCKGNPADHVQSVNAVRQDTILGGFWAENAWREPRYFDSQRKYEKALDASGLMLKPPKTRGAEPVSAETLAWAAKRVAERTPTVAIETRVLEETLTVQAEC